MASSCRFNGLTVRVNDVRLILKELDPMGVDLRTARRFRRRSYYSAGPNYVWHVDGYDKLKPFGLCISGCICGFSWKIIWLNVYHTNNNPRLIGGYFLEAVKQHRGCPLVVRGDLGTENGHDELDTAMEMWNAHSIRPVRNNYVPSGQPRIMYNFPCLWDCVDYIMPVSDADYSECAREAVFRSTVPCDADVLEI